MGGRLWTDEDRDKIVELYPTHEAEEIARLLGRTQEAVQNQVRILGLSWTKDRRPYDDDEIMVIMQRGRRADAGELGLALHRSVASIHKKARKVLGKRINNKLRSTEAKQEAKCLYDLGWGDQEIADRLGVAKAGIYRWRKRNGLPSHGWTARARRRVSAIRKRDRRMIHGVTDRHAANRARAAAMGWPMAKTPAQAKLLDALAERPMTMSEIAESFPTYLRRQCGYESLQCALLTRLKREGVVIRVGTMVSGAKVRHAVYGLAPGIRKNDHIEWGRKFEEALREYTPMIRRLAYKWGDRGGAIENSPEYADGVRGLEKALRDHDPERGEFDAYVFACIKGYIRTGRAARRGNVKVSTFSQFGPDADDDGYDPAAVMAVARDDSASRDAADQLGSLMGQLDERSRRLIRRVKLEGMDFYHAGQVESPQLTGMEVRDLIEEAMETMKQLVSGGPEDNDDD